MVERAGAIWLDGSQVLLFLCPGLKEYAAFFRLIVAARERLRIGFGRIRIRRGRMRTIEDSPVFRKRFPVEISDLFERIV